MQLYSNKDIKKKEQVRKEYEILFLFKNTYLHTFIKELKDVL